MQTDLGLVMKEWDDGCTYSLRIKGNDDHAQNCHQYRRPHRSSRPPPSPAPVFLLSTPTAPKPLPSPTPQIDVTYNVPDPVAKPSFQLLVNLQEPEAEQQRPPSPASSADDDDPAAGQHHQEYQVTLEVCTR